MKTSGDAIFLYGIIVGFALGALCAGVIVPVLWDRYCDWSLQRFERRSAADWREKRRRGDRAPTLP